MAELITGTLEAFGDIFDSAAGSLSGSDEEGTTE